MCTRIFGNDDDVAKVVGRTLDWEGARRDFSVHPTWWSWVIDLTHRMHVLQSTLAPDVVWIDLNVPVLAESTEVRTLDPTDPELVGDVTDRFEPAAAPF